MVGGFQCVVDVYFGDMVVLGLQVGDVLVEVEFDIGIDVYLCQVMGEQLVVVGLVMGQVQCVDQGVGNGGQCWFVGDDVGLVQYFVGYVVLGENFDVLG